MIYTCPCSFYGGNYKVAGPSSLQFVNVMRLLVGEVSSIEIFIPLLF